MSKEQLAAADFVTLPPGVPLWTWIDSKVAAPMGKARTVSVEVRRKLVVGDDRRLLADTIRQRTKHNTMMNIR